MNLYFISVDRKRTGMSLPQTCFVTIAKNIGEAEEIMIDYFKKEPEVIISKISLLRNNDTIHEDVCYVKNIK